MRKPFQRMYRRPTERRAAFFWYDVQELPWEKICLAAMAAVLVLAGASAILDPDLFSGGQPAEKCFNYGGRSDDIWNC